MRSTIDALYLAPPVRVTERRQADVLRDRLPIDGLVSHALPKRPVPRAGARVPRIVVLPNLIVAQDGIGPGIVIVMRVRDDERVDDRVVWRLAAHVIEQRRSPVRVIRTAVDDDVASLEAAVARDAVVRGVNPDAVSLPHVDDMHG